jgi:hypothetical protein
METGSASTRNSTLFLASVSGKSSSTLKTITRRTDGGDVRGFGKVIGNAGD